MDMSIEIGKSYEFHSTVMSDENLTPFSGQVVTVISPIELDDPDNEPMFAVRFADGHEGHVFEGEIDGYYLRTGQCVEEWRKDPSLAAQLQRDAERGGWG
jgi:hypothetical protein